MSQDVPNCATFRSRFDTESDAFAPARGVRNRRRPQTSQLVPRCPPCVIRIDSERLRHEPCVLLARRVMQVAHRGLDVRVPHPLLHAANVALGDHAGAERVAQVIQAQRPHPGRGESQLVAMPQGGPVEIVPVSPQNTRSSSPTEFPASRASPGLRRPPWPAAGPGPSPTSASSAPGPHSSPAPESPNRRNDLPPPQRQELSQPQRRECRGQVDRRVLRRGRCSRQRPHLLPGEHLECHRCAAATASPPQPPRSQTGPHAFRARLRIPCSRHQRLRATARRATQPRQSALDHLVVTSSSAKDPNTGNSYERTITL
jgi:hypothetical protein